MHMAPPAFRVPHDENPQIKIRDHPLPATSKKPAHEYPSSRPCCQRDDDRQARKVTMQQFKINSHLAEKALRPSVRDSCGLPQGLGRLWA
jgi:hypothetical protein